MKFCSKIQAKSCQAGLKKNKYPCVSWKKGIKN